MQVLPQPACEVLGRRGVVLGADELLHVVAQRLADLRLVDADDGDAFDLVAGVDVGGGPILLRQRNRTQDLKLRVGGSCGPADEPFVNALREKLKASGVLGDVEFCPNVDRAGREAFYRSLSVFSVPATYGEAFGLYVLEALASGVPVVQPRHAAFPELIEATG